MSLVFVFVDFLLMSCLLALVLMKVKAKKSRSWADNALMVLSLLFALKFLMGFLYQRNFHIGYFYHLVNQPDLAKKHFEMYLNQGPENRH